MYNNVFHVLSVWQSNNICPNHFSFLHDKFSTFLYSKLHTNVLTEQIHSLYQGFLLVLTSGKQFQVIHKQNGIQFEFSVAPIEASLNSSQKPCEWFLLILLLLLLLL